MCVRWLPRGDGIFRRDPGQSTPNVPADQIVDFMVEHNQWIVGTPEDCIAGIERLQEASGGFGGFMIRVEDYVQREKRLRSYELLARYVMPHFQGSVQRHHRVQPVGERA